MAFFVYILESLKDGSFYVGSTGNLEQRILRHNQGRSKYTKSKRPWKLVYFEKHPNRSAAVKREKQIKARKRRDYIRSLICSSNSIDG